MTEHLSESQLLALASEAPDAELTWRQHVADCPACRDKLAGYRATWQLLGCWESPVQLDQPSEDWQRALAARVTQQQWFIRWQGGIVWRIAAMILVAIGLGVGSAWFTAPALAEDPSQRAASAMFLDALSANRSSDVESALALPSAAEVQP